MTESLFLKDDESLRLPHKEPLRTDSYQELALLTEQCSFILLCSASLTLTAASLESCVPTDAAALSVLFISLHSSF